MASLEIREPPTFCTLPLEIRNYIYSLSGCHLKQFAASTIEEIVHILPDGTEEKSNCTKCYDWNTSSLEGTLRCSFSIWVNRHSKLVFHGARPNRRYFGKQELRKLGVSCKLSKDETNSLYHGSLHTDRIAQPPISFVSKQIRMEALQIFYGSQSFLFTLFDRDRDGGSIHKWLRTIGKQNAGYLRTINIVYRKKKDRKYIQKTLLPSMNKLGVKTEAKERVVIVLRLEYPFCYCEGCTRKLLGEG